MDRCAPIKALFLECFSYRLTLGFMLSAMALEPVEAKVLKLVTGDKFGVFVDRKLKGDGVFTETVRKVFNHLGYEVQIDFVPWKRALDLTKRGDYLATFPWSETSERKSDFIFSNPIFSYKILTYVPKNSPLQEIKKNGRKTLSTCDIIGSSLAQHLPKEFKVKVHYVRQNDQCLAMQKSGRLDFGMVPEIMLQIIPIEYRIVPNDFDIHVSLHLIAQKEYPQAQFLMNEFNRGLAELGNKKALPTLPLVK